MKKRILVVEDRETERRCMEALLKSHGYDVATAPNGAEAIAAVGDEAPDLVLLDMFMPEADGWHFLRHRMKHPMLLNVPVLVITGMPIATEAWAFGVSAHGLIKKPIDVGELMKKVEELTGQATSEL